MRPTWRFERYCSRRCGFEGSFAKRTAGRLGQDYDTVLIYIAAGNSWCSGCKMWKDVKLFWKDRHNKSGISKTCKACNRPRLQLRRKRKPSDKKYYVVRHNPHWKEKYLELLKKCGKPDLVCEVMGVSTGTVSDRRKKSKDFNLAYFVATGEWMLNRFGMKKTQQRLVHRIKDAGIYASVLKTIGEKYNVDDRKQ